MQEITREKCIWYNFKLAKDFFDTYFLISTFQIHLSNILVKLSVKKNEKLTKKNGRDDSKKKIIGIHYRYNINRALSDEVRTCHLPVDGSNEAISVIL